MDTLTLPVAPSYDSKVTTAHRALVANLGDGYTVRAGDGLNTKKRTWSLSWEVISIADADTIETFINSQGGYKAFIWVPPRGPTGKWICQSFDRQAVGPGYDSMSMEFEEVFDL